MITAPAPDKAPIWGAVALAEMSSTPLSVMPPEVAMLPEPDSASVAGASMTVLPV